MAQTAVLNVRERELTILGDSIVKIPERVDALVSSDDNYLTHGGGVSEVIWKQAGPALAEFVEDHIQPLGLGSLFISPPGNLKADHLVHAVTIDLDSYRRARPRDIQDLYAALFTTAAERKWDSIALPLLGAGAGRVGPLEVTRSFMVALREHLGAYPKRVILCVIPPDFDRCLKELSKVEDDDPWIPLKVGQEVAAKAIGGLVGFGWSPLGLMGSAVYSILRGISDWDPSRLTALSGEVSSPKLIVSLERMLEHLLRTARKLARAMPASKSPPNDHPAAENGGIPPIDMVGAQPLSLAGKWRLAVDTLESAGIPVPQNIRAAVEEAIQARNILVHKGPNPDDSRVLFHGLGELAGWIQELDPSFAKSLPEILPPPELAGPAPLEVGSTDGKDVPTAPAIVQPEGRGTRPVIELRRFLKEVMEPDDLEDLVLQHQQDGYKGDFDSILLELCVQSKDLANLLTEHVTAPKLRRKLRDRGLVVTPGMDGRMLAERLLEYMGFPKRHPVIGINRLRQQFEEARHAIMNASPTVVSGHVVECSKDLEWCLKVFVRFLAQWAFKHKNPNRFLIERGWMGSTYRLDGLGLGNLVDIIQKMESEIRGSDEFRDLCLDLGSEPMLPSYTGKIVEVRNLFSHDKRDQGGQEKLPDARIPSEGRKFLDLACNLLEHLGRPEFRSFPFIVRIESISIDHYGRRTVKATSDGESGKTEETIFAEVELRPGEHYLMRPLSNPWRVNPVLVSLGDDANRES
jgi:O-acetyl-ADP-ribose deacetylase (regulator of RNase III)